MAKMNTLLKYNFKKEVVDKSKSDNSVSKKSSENKNPRFQPLSFLSDSEEMEKSKIRKKKLQKIKDKKVDSQNSSASKEGSQNGVKKYSNIFEKYSFNSQADGKIDDENGETCNNSKNIKTTLASSLNTSSKDFHKFACKTDEVSPKNMNKTNNNKNKILSTKNNSNKNDNKNKNISSDNIPHKKNPSSPSKSEHEKKQSSNSPQKRKFDNIKKADDLIKDQKIEKRIEKSKYTKKHREISPDKQTPPSPEKQKIKDFKYFKDNNIFDKINFDIDDDMREKKKNSEKLNKKKTEIQKDKHQNRETEQKLDENTDNQKYSPTDKKAHTDKHKHTKSLHKQTNAYKQKETYEESPQKHSQKDKEKQNSGQKNKKIHLNNQKDAKSPLKDSKKHTYNKTIPHKHINEHKESDNKKNLQKHTVKQTESQTNTPKKTEIQANAPRQTESQTNTQTSKRTNTSSQLSPIIAPSNKKKTFLSSDDDDDDDDDNINNSSDNKNNNNSNKNTNNDDDDGFIGDDVPNGLCRKLMAKQQNGLVKSPEKISGSSQSPQKTGSQRVNLGSLKAFSWSRAQDKLKLQQQKVQLSLSPKKKLKRLRVCDEEDEDEKPTQPKLKHQKLLKSTINEDGDEDYDNKKNRKDDDDEDGDDDDDDYGDDLDKGGVLMFLNMSSQEELVSIDGCSSKKVSLIIEQRPFADWDHLHQVLTAKPGLGKWVVDGCMEVLRLRQGLASLMKRCGLISQSLQDSIMPGKNSIKSSQFTKQPSNLNSNLKLADYQLQGLNWLVMMHKQKLNGILGDEMGLGKTIQTIAFLAYLQLHNFNGPHVVVAPSSTIDNWLRELKSWCPSLSVLPYHGSQQERKEMRIQMIKGFCDVDVVVTSYNMAASTAEDRLLFKKMSFGYAIFDEGHMLKNMTTSRYKSLLRIQAQYRLLLTGTPLQNNLLELISLLTFLMPDIFAGNALSLKKLFAVQTDKTTKKDSDKSTSYATEVLENAKKILQPFFLRRLKKDVLNQLPNKTEEVVKVEMPARQKKLYCGIVASCLQDLKQSNEGIDVMMKLRKAANHPLLHRSLYNDEAIKYLSKNIIKDRQYRDCSIQCVYEDMEVMSDFELHNLCLKCKVLHHKALNPEVVCQSAKFQHLDQLLPKLHKKGDRVLLFSQFTMVLDIVEVYLQKRSHTYLRLDGGTRVADRQELIDEYNTNPNIFVFLLTTRAAGVGINLSTANTVIIHDPDFNPYNDKQAQDRCHRVGQTRDVTVYKLITKGSIEEGIHKCAVEKLQLEKDVTYNEEADVAMLLKEALKMK